MKTNRIKSIEPVIRTRQEMEALVGEIAAIKNRRRLLAAAMDEQLQSVREQYELQFAGQNEILAQKMERARAWSVANPQEFGGQRSIETVHGAVGWRTGAPSLRTLPGRTWDQVKDTLKATGARDYIRVKEEVNKQALLSDREILGPENLGALGLRVVREETFYVEPKSTPLPAMAEHA